ncbi:hypothetical protein [Paenibacillus oryzisoli]|uniref:Uncharacterized protein n=1 Tax=Paenibacillus oryzisoli TaxID=1850517 RepID=A0A197ZX11_9BACL|nr:hypothetical protein [Paenibacillus oryzisoli]OAS13530.1 hypothetical protein A8708_24010 [Paenibacillus oryzisoli]
MWNLYEIEKKFEDHVKDIEARARKAHWYTKEKNVGVRPGVLASWVSLFALVIVGIIAVYKVF